MSSTQFNNKRQSFKPELIHLNGDFARRIKKKYLFLVELLVYYME